VKRIVYSSSCAVYGNAAEKPANEETSSQPLTFYGLSKLVGENYCRLFSNLYPQIETVCLRYFNVFGLRQNPSSSYAGVIPIFLRCLRDGLRPTIFGDGHQTRDFIDVSDIVTANIAAMESHLVLRGECFNVGTGTSISILELWKCLAEIAKSDLCPQFARARAGDIQSSRADITKIQGALRFQPKVNWQEGLKRLWSVPDDNK
jgi:UDP-glucose 4-epimerase